MHRSLTASIVTTIPWSSTATQRPALPLARRPLAHPRRRCGRRQLACQPLLAKSTEPAQGGRAAPTATGTALPVQSPQRSVLPEGTGVSTQAGYRETLMRGLLARVGLDSTPEYGGSNAPMKPDRSFLYVPIPETDPESGAPLKQRKGMETRYSEINTGQFGWSLPLKLMGENTHFITGLQASQLLHLRSRRICIEPVTKGDFVVFFASLVPTEGPKRPLAYVLIGQIFIRDIIAFDEVPKDEYHN